MYGIQIWADWDDAGVIDFLWLMVDDSPRTFTSRDVADSYADCMNVISDATYMVAPLPPELINVGN